MFEFIKAGKNLLGMNARNLTFIRPNNLKRAKKIADNKILSKKILAKNNMPVPKLIAKITCYQDLESFDWDSLPPSFVLKPNNGFGGSGILVVFARKKNCQDQWVKADGSTVSIADLTNQVRNILDGSFSLSNSPDTAFFEERLQIIKEFKPYCYKGIPDVRVIVYNKVPIMAMLRIPTKQSDGKANLQQGGIGIGIDLARGVTTTAVQGKGKIVEYLPDSRLLLSGVKIPFWDEILKLAVKAQIVSGLGYLGADIAIDRKNGPVFLELNARPGLAIQIANMTGLKSRLERVEGLKIKSVMRGVAVGKNLFGGEIEEELEEISGKRVIGSIEKVKLIGKDGQEVEIEAKIDTGADWSSMDNELAKKLGFKETVKEFEKLLISYEELSKMKKDDRWDRFKNVPDIVSTIPVKSSNGYTYRPMVDINFKMDGFLVSTKITLVDRSHMKYAMIVGKKNLDSFLIDISK